MIELCRRWLHRARSAIGPARLSVLACMLLLVQLHAAQARDLVVFGEPTLERGLRQVGAKWREHAGIRVNVFVAPSDLSFAQIQRGARCDIVFALAGSAATAAGQAGTVKAATIRPVFRNSLVLIGRPGPNRSSPVVNRSDIASMLKSAKLAVANPDRDPAGIYALLWLREIGIPDNDGNVLVAENSAGVVQLITDNTAQLGIVYATDSAARPDLPVLMPVVEPDQRPFDYVVAEAMNAESDSKPFMEFLGSTEAKAVLRAAGLHVVSE